MKSPLRLAGMTAALLAVLCGGVGAAQSQPADSAQAKARLAAVRARIAELTAHISDELKQRDAESARLRESDLAIATKRQRLEALRAAAAAAERRRSELRGAEQRAQSELQSARATLAAQVRAAYMIGRHEELQLLLNQSDPASLGRTLTYLGFLAQQLSRKIDAVLEDEARLQQLVAQIGQQTQQLQALENNATQEIADLTQARAERALAVAALRQRLESGNRELGDLKREEQAVESLVADLEKVLQDYPVDATESFDHMRGRLPWPVPGRISARYQESRENSPAGTRWNGVLIDAGRGAKVRAPFFGRVVYADWLQGLGLLLIIGHSGGYMTLYGRAEVLYKAVGDWVSPGDVIAALSDSDSRAAQLYFEIRDGRKTVDPKVWLK